MDCFVCHNDDPSVCEFQRCDGDCGRWFCIEGDCARVLLGKKGSNLKKLLDSGADLVCKDCRRDEKLQVAKKLKELQTRTPTTAGKRPLRVSDEQPR